MLYSILIYGSDAAVTGLSKEEDAAMIASHVSVQQKLIAERKLGPVVRLMPSTAALTVRKGGEPLVIDGPYAETKEQLLGLYVLDCATPEEAIEAARLIDTCCNSMALEIRPVSWFAPGGQMN